MDIRPGAILEAHKGPAITIESLLGRGGFGQVFLGRLADKTPVAVKTVLTASLDANELKALQKEAQHATAIEHPNVVRVLYVSTGEGAAGQPPYLVMEFVGGGTDVLEIHRAAKTKPTVDELGVLRIAD
jgi:serine/threonine protein kinase